MGLINVKWKGSSLKQDSSNRLVTDSEKTTWNNKANNSHTHTKSQVGLGNVDNTADSAKNVAMATKLQTYKSNSTTETYGTEYPLFAQWDSTGKIVNLVCTGYTVKTGCASVADSAKSVTWENVFGSPTSLKNPNSLTIQLNNGNIPETNLFIYDGDTEKTVNITPSAIGAAPSDHGHEHLNLNLGMTVGGDIYAESGRTPNIGSLSSPFYDAYIKNKLNITRNDKVYGMLYYDPTPKAACLVLGRTSSGNIINSYLYGSSEATSNCNIDLPASSGTLQVSSSDIRLKENIKDTDINALSLINNIKVRQFDWKEKNKGHQSIGFIADELEELDENFRIGGNSDELDENGLPMHPKCVNTFYLQGYEVKAIQELSSKVDNKVDALEKENNKLKDIINQLLERVTTLENK